MPRIIMLLNHFLERLRKQCVAWFRGYDYGTKQQITKSQYVRFVVHLQDFRLGSFDKMSGRIDRKRITFVMRLIINAYKNVLMRYRYMVELMGKCCVYHTAPCIPAHES